MTTTMNMLPNDHHPGPRCSCAECQRRYPEVSAPAQPTSKELVARLRAVAGKGDIYDLHGELELAAADEIERLRTQNSNLQAKIDALMLEFCPGEMSAEQRANWANSQQRAEFEPAAEYVMKPSEEATFDKVRRKHIVGALKPPEAAPVAWQRVVDSAYELRPSMQFSDSKNRPMGDGWEPLYKRPAQPPLSQPVSMDREPLDIIMRYKAERTNEAQAAAEIVRYARAVQPPCANDARDAARYRFLRQPGNAIVYAKDRNAWGAAASGHVRYDTSEQLDTAVDAAIAASGPTKCQDCDGTKQTLADRGNFEPTLGPCPTCTAAGERDEQR